MLGLRLQNEADIPPSRELVRLGVHLDSTPRNRVVVKDTYPFLEYATRNVLYHADIAAGHQIDQTDFLANFPRSSWIEISNVVEKHKIRQYTSEASLLYILAEGNLPHLIGTYPSRLSYLSAENERYGTPLFAAFAMKGEQAIHAFLQAELRAVPSQRLQELYKSYRALESGDGKLGRTFQFQSGEKSVLSYLPELGDDGIVFNFLVEAGKVDLSSKIGVEKAFFAAVHSAKYGIVKLLLDLGTFDANSQDTSGDTALAHVARTGDEKMLKILLSYVQVDPNVKDEHGFTSLSRAFLHRQVAMAELLAAHDNIDLNTKDCSGNTPLHYASSNFSDLGPLVHFELLYSIRLPPEPKDEFIAFTLMRLLLLKTGSNLNPVNHDGMTPLAWACRLGLESIVFFLLNLNGVNINAKDDRERTPLWWAIRVKAHRIVELLLAQESIVVNTKDNEGCTPLSMATRCGYDEIILMLLGHSGIEIDTEDIAGYTPLMWAVWAGRKTVTKLLSTRENVDVNTRDRKGRTPLACAACSWEWTDLEGSIITMRDVGLLRVPDIERHPYDVVHILLETERCDVHLADHDGATPLQRAILHKNHAVVDLLRLYISENPICLDQSHGHVCIDLHP